MQSAVSSISQRLQRLQLAPHKVLAVFHPPADAAAAQWAWQQLADPARAQLQQVLLSQDVRDDKQRNVLHLAVTHS
jgi:hypothetical protein